MLKKLAEGSYTKIIDPTLRRIWEKEVRAVGVQRCLFAECFTYGLQKWPISVDVSRFIQSVQDHLEQDVPESEAWAVRFLAVSHRTALLNVVDPDFSGFVSVNEANKFTNAKPGDQRWEICQ